MYQTIKHQPVAKMELIAVLMAFVLHMKLIVAMQGKYAYMIQIVVMVLSAMQTMFVK